MLVVEDDNDKYAGEIGGIELSLNVTPTAYQRLLINTHYSFFPSGLLHMFILVGCTAYIYLPTIALL